MSRRIHNTLACIVKFILKERWSLPDKDLSCSAELIAIKLKENEITDSNGRGDIDANPPVRINFLEVDHKLAVTQHYCFVYFATCRIDAHGHRGANTRSTTARFNATCKITGDTIR